jgi:hypothetical protein
LLDELRQMKALSQALPDAPIHRARHNEKKYNGGE